MTNKIKYILIAATVFTTVVALAVLLSQEKKAARNAKLEQNVREAALGGAPDLSLAPKADFLSQTFDVGLVNPLDKASRLITVQNHGKRPLKVRLLNRACSCVAVSVKDEKIYPGQNGVIEFVFTAPADEKEVDHAVVFSTNDPLQKEVTVHVTGSVRRTVWTEPQRLDFTQMSPGEARQRELRVYSSWEEGFELARLGGLPGDVAIAKQPLQEDELQAAGAKSGQLLTITFPASWSGKLSSAVTFDAVRAEGDESLHKSVALTASRLGRISLSHDRLDVLGKFEIGNIPYGTGRQYTLFVEARGTNKQLRLERVEAEPTFLNLSLEPGVNVATSGLHRLKFEIPPDAPEGSYAGEERGSVTLHFDDPEYPTVTFHPAFQITRD